MYCKGGILMKINFIINLKLLDGTKEYIPRRYIKKIMDFEVTLW